MGADGWSAYRSTVVMLSVAELTAILLSLLGGFLYFNRTRSWKLLLHQTILLPLLIAYIYYLVSPRNLCASALIISYHAALFAISHTVAWSGLINRRVLLWAFVGAHSEKPDVPGIRWHDVIFLVVTAAAAFTYCVYIFSTAITIAPVTH
jgi:hypothetical protein